MYAKLPDLHFEISALVNVFPEYVISFSKAEWNKDFVWVTFITKRTAVT